VQHGDDLKLVGGHAEHDAQGMKAALAAHS